MMSPPLVSFVIAVHNGARFLEATLASVSAQTHRALDIVIVDDGSTDGSTQLARQWTLQDPRCRVIETTHAGPQEARNIGVAEARGDFVAHLDHDDIAAPARVATQLAWMKAHHVDVCGSCTMVCGEQQYLGWVPERHVDILRESVFRCGFVHPTTLLPSTLAKAHSFNPRHRCGGDELPIRLAISHGARLGNVPLPLIKYRHHANQRTRVERRAIIAHRREIRRRVFRHLFADATATDADAVLRIGHPAGFTSDASRTAAAAWMARLVESDDPMVRRLMAERWEATVALAGDV
jgi:glycosyltransferase involved in cell wall biosynthesis